MHEGTSYIICYMVMKDVSRAITSVWFFDECSVLDVAIGCHQILRLQIRIEIVKGDYRRRLCN